MPRHRRRKEIEAIIGELQSCLPKYDNSPKEYPSLLFRVLASVPGGEELEDVGYERFNLGWSELGQLGRLLIAIQNKCDVEDIVQALRRRSGPEERRAALASWQPSAGRH